MRSAVAGSVGYLSAADPTYRFTTEFGGNSWRNRVVSYSTSGSVVLSSAPENAEYGAIVGTRFGSGEKKVT